MNSTVLGHTRYKWAIHKKKKIHLFPIKNYLILHKIRTVLAKTLFNQHVYATWLGTIWSKDVNTCMLCLGAS